MAVGPPVLREMTLREIRAHLLALAPPPVDEETALMMQHPGLQGR